jgi:dGTPase
LLWFFSGVFEVISEDVSKIAKKIDCYDENKDEIDMLIMQCIIKSDIEGDTLSDNAYDRTKFTSTLVDTFIKGVEFEFCEKFPSLSSVKLNQEIEEYVLVLKALAYHTQIDSSKLKIVEHRGYDIVKSLFTTISNHNKRGYLLMPEDFKENYLNFKDKQNRMRVVCDFISSMTDRYALEYYCRLFSEDPQSIFKPL